MTASSFPPPNGDPRLKSVRILLVDDDEHWAWATKRMLEGTDSLTVETAHSLSEGRETFARVDPDCVVCDYQLGDGTGFAMLEAVRDRDSDCPFLLVTGKGDEAIAGEAVRRGVDDYIRKGRDGEDDLIANRVTNLVRSNRIEQALEREKQAKTAILDVLRETTSEVELCRQFCRRLVETDAYAMAWIGTTDGEYPTPRTCAGRDGYLEAIGPEDLPPDEPARAAYDRAEPVAVSSVDSEEGWQAAADAADFQSVIAAPIRYDSITFGVLAVYLEKSLTDTSETDAITEYAESVGYALQSFDRKRSLLSSTPVRVETTLTDERVPLVALDAHLPSESSIESPSVIARGDQRTLYVLCLDGATRSTVQTAVESVESLSLLEITGSGPDLKCRVETSAPTPEGLLVDAGARFEGTQISDGTATVRARLPADSPVSQLATAIEGPFQDATVSTVWTDHEPTETTEDLFGELTDKQRTILRHAFHEGYFERPREANATEIAERLGISRQTFAQHLSAAQRKVFSAWQSNTSQN